VDQEGAGVQNLNPVGGKRIITKQEIPGVEGKNVKIRSRSEVPNSPDAEPRGETVKQSQRTWGRGFIKKAVSSVGSLRKRGDSGFFQIR